MSKTLFLTKIDFKNLNNIGICNKILAQLSAFRDAELTTDLCYINGNCIVLSGIDFENKWIFNGFLSSIRKFLFYFLVLPFLLKSKHYDNIYIRHYLTSPFFLIQLLIFRTNNLKLTILLEFPTYPYIPTFSNKDFKTKIKLYIDVFTTKFYFLIINRLVLLSNLKKALGMRSINIDNGISLSNISFANKKKIKNDTLNILCLAHLQFWHGYDRILLGSKNYINNGSDSPKIVIHIVGNGPEEKILKQKSKALNLEEYVIFHGFLSGNELDKIFEISDIAIGAIGLHRVNGVNGEISPLKTREYIARGILYVYANEDKHIDSTFKYGLKVLSDESAIDIKSLIDFHENISENLPNYSLEMRKFAEENLIWEKTMKPVFDFIKK